MKISIFPVTPSFVAEKGDLDLVRPLAEEDLKVLRDAFATYAVLVFPAQDLGLSGSNLLKSIPLQPQSKAMAPS